MGGKTMPKLPDGLRCYVYEHVNPDTGEVVYVGKGSGQRAWMCTGGYDEAHYGNRSREHVEYLKGLMGEGYLPCDWVVVVRRGMSGSDAVRLEQDFIRKMGPRFNRSMGIKLCKLKGEDYRSAKALRKEGKTYKDVAGALGVGVMTVYRALNGRNKNRMEAA
jgi:hypothetical protein